MKYLLSRPMQSTFSDDKHYLDVISDKTKPDVLKSKAKESLFFKYLPLTMKMADKFGMKGEDKEDFISESYVVLQRTIGFVDVTRIDKKFSFGYFFRLDLMNLGIKWMKRNKKRNKTTSYDNLVDINSPQLSHLTVEESEVFADIFDDKAIALSVLDNLPKDYMKERDKDILKAVLMGIKPKDVATEFGLSEQRVKGICNSRAEDLRVLVT